MRYKKQKTILAAALAAVLLVTSAGFSLPVRAETLSELEDQKTELEQQKAENDEKLKDLKADITKQEEYLATLQEQQRTLEGQIDTLNQETQELDDQILALEGQISEKQKKIDADMETLKARLRALYIAGDASTLEIILNCENLIDFAEKTEFIKAITEHDSKLMSELSEDIAGISSEKDKIQSYKDQVLEDKKDLDAKREELSGLYEEAQSVMDSLNQDKSDAENRSSELEGDLSEAESAIDAWYEDYYAQQNTPDNNSTGSGDSGDNGGSSGNGSGGGSNGGGVSGTGMFIWPVPGYTWLSSYWGDGRNHQAIDIAGSGIYGAPIVAADSGTVSYAESGGWGGGYGTWLIVDHGNGYSTVYAHLSGLAVSQGESVSQGQVVGYVGSTGDSSGPHMHIEVREYGVRVNPLNWFSGVG